MSNLANQHCVPCRTGLPPLTTVEAKKFVDELEGWVINHKGHIEKSYDFPDFAGALAFVNLVGSIAEAEAHHPDVYLAWGKVRLEIWTHAVDGLSHNDFILAAKVDRALIGG